MGCRWVTGFLFFCLRGRSLNTAPTVSSKAAAKTPRCGCGGVIFGAAFEKRSLQINSYRQKKPIVPPINHPLHPLQNPLPTGVPRPTNQPSATSASTSAANQGPTPHHQPIRYIRFKIRCQPKSNAPPTNHPLHPLQNPLLTKVQRSTNNPSAIILGGHFGLCRVARDRV